VKWLKDNGVRPFEIPTVLDCDQPVFSWKDVSEGEGSIAVALVHSEIVRRRDKPAATWSVARPDRDYREAGGPVDVSPARKRWVGDVYGRASWGAACCAPYISFATAALRLT
jgi:hypothetical protein